MERKHYQMDPKTYILRNKDRIEERGAKEPFYKTAH